MLSKKDTGFLSRRFLFVIFAKLPGKDSHASRGWDKDPILAESGREALAKLGASHRGSFAWTCDYQSYPGFGETRDEF